MLARCIPLALALAAAAAEGSLPARQLMRAEFDARTDADGTVRLLDSYIRQVVNASNLAAMDCSNMVLRNTGLSDLLQGDCVRSKAECGSAYCPNDWVSFEVDYSGQKVIKSECRVQAETECGINCKSRKAGVCSTRSRADCAHGFEMSGSVGYVCKWNDGDGACYRAGASDEADYPEKFRKCFVTHN
mmetsp:Transcript_128553/g.181350  ORF Transcript_128553/g.181350 Transcript_128553/m.181350 type:complete len:188 (+) Transcript_128553:76-639(+)